MSAVVVIKSSPVVVIPSESEPEPVPLLAGETVSLSSFDKCVAPFPVTMLLGFDLPIHAPVEAIKGALSRALAHYRPVAGRLSTGPGDGEVSIACTGEGVAFVGASANCTLAEATTAQLKDLVVRYPGDFCRDTDPLLLLQVTEFSCGGFVVGVTFNHIIADGAGIAQFLGAVGDLARGVSPPSVVPIRQWDDRLPGLPSSMVSGQKSTMTHGRLDLARLDIVIPFSLISEIKAESGGTAFEIVAAVLWRCRTHAIISPDDPEFPAPLGFPSDVRALVGASAGYYGNCVVVQLVPATSSAVASGRIGDLVALIKRAREKVPDLLQLSNGAAAPEAAAPEPGAAAEGGEVELGYNALVVVSWQKLGLDAVDLGAGGPARVTWHEERPVVPGCVACPPRRGEGNGVGVTAICVKTEHTDAFVEELVTMGIRIVPSNL
jgi:hypothetical protein